MSFVLLDDGHTYRCRIDGVVGLHGALDFSRRVMVPADVEEHQAAIENALRIGRPRQASELAAKTIAKFVTEWNVVDQKKNPVPVTAAAASRLPPALFNKLLTVLQGSRPTDVRSDWSPEELAEYQQRDIPEETARGN